MIPKSSYGPISVKIPPSTLEQDERSVGHRVPIMPSALTWAKSLTRLTSRLATGASHGSGKRFAVRPRRSSECPGCLPSARYRGKVAGCIEVQPRHYPDRSRSGEVISPARVVGPTRV